MSAVIERVHAASGKRAAAITLSLALVSMAAGAPMAVMMGALPAIAASVDASPTQAGWFLTGPLLITAVTLPLMARAGTLYGNRLVSTGLLVVGVIGSLIAAMASSAAMIIVAMCVIGVGLVIPVMAFAMVAEHLDTRRRATAIGVLGGSYYVASGLTSLATGPILDHLSFRWLFAGIAAVFALSAAALVSTVPAHGARQKGRLDWGGAGIVAIAIGAMLLAATEAPSWGWFSVRTLGVAVVGVVVLVVWVQFERSVEKRGDVPLISVQLGKNPAVLGAAVAALFATAVMYGFVVMVNYFAATDPVVGYGFGLSSTDTTRMFVLVSACAAVGSFAVGQLDRWVDPKWTLLLAALLLVAACVFILLLHTQVWHVWVTEAIFGVASGLGYAGFANFMVRHVIPVDVGPATSMNFLAQSLGGAVGTSVLAAVLMAGTDVTSSITSKGAYITSWIVCLGASALFALIALWLPRARRIVGHDDALART